MDSQTTRSRADRAGRRTPARGRLVADGGVDVGAPAADGGVDVDAPATDTVCDNGHANDVQFLDQIGDEWLCPLCGATIPDSSVVENGLDDSLSLLLDERPDTPSLFSAVPTGYHPGTVSTRSYRAVGHLLVYVLRGLLVVSNVTRSVWNRDD